MEQFTKIARKYGVRTQRLTQYEYRHTDGDVFSCTKRTLNACRKARDKWLIKKREMSNGAL